jgi:hypothetical protein
MPKIKDIYSHSYNRSPYTALLCSHLCKSKNYGMRAIFHGEFSVSYQEIKYVAETDRIILSKVMDTLT